MSCKSFHFQEIDCMISFPTCGNEGKKYANYTVDLINRAKHEGKSQIVLCQFLDSRHVDYNYPHTVCFFKGSINEANTAKPTYLEIRIIRCVEEFWKFLNDLDI